MMLLSMILIGFNVGATQLGLGDTSLMKGAGSFQRGTDGGTTFIYVFPTRAYDGVIDDPEKLREQHEFMISKFVGTANECLKGYTIIERQTVSENYVYTGACK